MHLGIIRRSLNPKFGVLVHARNLLDFARLHVTEPELIDEIIAEYVRFTHRYGAGVRPDVAWRAGWRRQGRRQDVLPFGSRIARKNSVLLAEPVVHSKIVLVVRNPLLLV